MEEERIRSARLIEWVKMGIVGSLLPSCLLFIGGFLFGSLPWEEIIYLTASGALGGSLAWLIFRKLRSGQIVAGIFGLIAALITLFYVI